MTRLLSLAGKHGPAVLFGGVLLGLLLPPLADAAKPMMSIAVFVFTLGAFLKVDRPGLQEQLVRPLRLAAMLTWVVLGVPLTTCALLTFFPLAAEAKTGLLLCALGPPVGSAAAIAAMLRLKPALALTMTVVASVLSPLTLPGLALALGGIHVEIDAAAVVWRMACVVGGAGVAAALLRRFAGDVVRDNPQAMTGISVVGLIVVAVGAMQGMVPQMTQHPAGVATALAVAFTFNVALQVLGAALFARVGADEAMTIGLVSGNRNVTLVWVAVQPWLGATPGVDLMFAASVFPIFMLPLATTKLLEARRGRHTLLTGTARGAS
jgi:arsenite transporter